MEERFHWAGAAYLLLDAAEKLGVDKERVLERAGLVEAELPPSPGRIGWPQLKAITAAALELTGEAGIGLLAGRLRALHYHGVAGVYGMQLTPSRRLQQHVYGNLWPRLTSLVQFRHEESGEFTLNCGQLLVQGDPLLEIHLHMFLGMHLAAYRGIFGDQAQVDHIAIRSNACGSAEHLTALMKCCPVRTGQPGDWVAVPRDLMDRPFPLADPWLREQLQPQMDAFLRLLDESKDASLRVRAVLAQELQSGKLPELKQVAFSLRVNAHTLRAQLGVEGTTFSAILDAVRKEFALQQLASGDFSATAVGAQVGFSEPGAFTRAFKRWTGTTPTEWRERHAK